MKREATSPISLSCHKVNTFLLQKHIFFPQIYSLVKKQGRNITLASLP